MNIEPIALRIKKQMSDGVVQLTKAKTFWAVEGIMRSGEIVTPESLPAMTPDKIITKLTTDLLDAWPLPLRCAYDEISRALRPFADIQAILNDQTELVSVSPMPCVMEDSRMPLTEFKEALRRFLFDGASRNPVLNK